STRPGDDRLSSRTSRARAGVLAALALTLALAGCSDDDDTSASSAPAADAVGDTDAGSSDDEGAAGAQQALADAVGGDGERPFGVSAEDLAVAMQAATRADRVEVDGNTFRLYFDEGSVEDVTARTKCSAMNMI